MSDDEKIVQTPRHSSLCTRITSASNVQNVAALGQLCKLGPFCLTAPLESSWGKYKVEAFFTSLAHTNTSVCS
ncbi:hypothetical protein Csa_021150 [Cucumis sativus]|uniref:Uncharacterized protein n=1 Tax=Cucumis sativus TaxID=3659 RepID=A0A0A0LLT0_CUCSA|nr:hypothetical protein Csa_021150 [Cucumis sativus]